VVAVGTEIVGVHRAEERIVRVLVVRQLRQQRLEAGPSDRWRKLERLGWHVAVRARASVASELAEIAVVESRTTASHGWLSQLSFVAPFPCAMTRPALASERTAATRDTPAATRVNQTPVFAHRALIDQPPLLLSYGSAVRVRFPCALNGVQLAFVGPEHVSGPSVRKASSRLQSANIREKKRPA
jgi:hypothetical protein